MRLVHGLLAAAGLAVLAVLPVPVAAQTFDTELPCDATVPERLSALGVDRAKIASSLTEERWNYGDRHDVFLGWTVWMHLEGCDGRFVMRLSTGCTVETVYTTGQCRVNGVHHSR